MLKEHQRLVLVTEQTHWASCPRWRGGGREPVVVNSEPPEPAWMSGGREATWPKSGAAVINSPCLGFRHRNETDEGSGWWMRAGAGADKTWPMNLFYIIGCFDHWQKFRDGPVHLSKQTKASSLPEHPPPPHTHLLHNTTTVHQPLRSDTLPLRLALTRKQTAEKTKTEWQGRYAAEGKMER